MIFFLVPSSVRRVGRNTTSPFAEHGTHDLPRFAFTNKTMDEVSVWCHRNAHKANLEQLLRTIRHHLAKTPPNTPPYTGINIQVSTE